MHISENTDRKIEIQINEDFNRKSLFIMITLFILSTLLITCSLNIITSLIELVSIILVGTSLLIYLKAKYEVKKIERSIYRNYTKPHKNNIELLEIDADEILCLDEEK